MSNAFSAFFEEKGCACCCIAEIAHGSLLSGHPAVSLASVYLKGLLIQISKRTKAQQSVLWEVFYPFDLSMKCG